jgi:hypothetical protein
MADDGRADALYSVKKRKWDANGEAIVDASLSRPNTALRPAIEARQPS